MAAPRSPKSLLLQEERRHFVEERLLLGPWLVARSFVNRGDFTVEESGRAKTRRILRILVESNTDSRFRRIPMGFRRKAQGCEARATQVTVRKSFPAATRCGYSHPFIARDIRHNRVEAG